MGKLDCPFDASETTGKLSLAHATQRRAYSRTVILIEIASHWHDSQCPCGAIIHEISWGHHRSPLPPQAT